MRKAIFDSMLRIKGAGVLDEKQSVGGREAAIEPTRMYSRRVCVRPDTEAPDSHSGESVALGNAGSLTTTTGAG